MATILYGSKVKKKVRCRRCGLEFLIDENIDLGGVTCPNCGSDDLEFLGYVAYE